MSKIGGDLRGCWGLGTAWAAALLSFIALPLQASDADVAAWDLLRRGGVAVLIRHAHAPGTGDPAGFRLDDCASQRNLSASGRFRAREIGEAFRRERVAIRAVYSSQWCRCKDTAALAFGYFEEHEALNSFFGAPREEPERVRGMRTLLDRSRAEPGVLVLVTHQVNITALTGMVPREGEVVVVRVQAGGQAEVAARLVPGN